MCISYRCSYVDGFGCGMHAACCGAMAVAVGGGSGLSPRVARKYHEKCHDSMGNKTKQNNAPLALLF